MFKLDITQNNKNIDTGKVLINMNAIFNALYF